MKRYCVLLSLLALSSLFSQAAPAQTRAKNVILMVSDGAGFNTWRATDMYEGKLGKQIYDGPGWVKSACSTYPLTQSTKPTNTLVQDATLVYDPAKAWDTALLPKLDSKGKPETSGPFAGYRFLKKTYTDSAAAASAMSTGQKTYDNAINWSNLNKPFSGRTIAEIAKRQGKSVGAITTVQWSHATPAGLGGAHNVSRNNYEEIANEMLNAAHLDVIMGAGNPDFDDDGRPFVEPKPVQPAAAKDAKAAAKDAKKAKEAAAAALKKRYQYVGGQATWKLLTSGKHPAGRTLVQSKAAFEALTSGPTPRRLVGTAQAATTLQENRGKAPAAGAPTPPPFTDPFNANVPSLETMTKAALNCLDNNPDGFYLIIEGGAVDWANHGNRPERMIEEQIDFLRALAAVVRWVESNSNWDETLLIVTADHETGLIWGPNSDRIPFEPIVDRGKGNIPGLKYNYTSHTNSLLPLYARGPGSQRFAKLIRGFDPTAAEKFGFSGRYVENTAVFAVMKASIAPAAEPAQVSQSLVGE